MQDKGYPFPLYSLDLFTPASVPAAEAPYAIPAPGGRLLVRPGLRRRALHHGTEVVYRALVEALAIHRQRAAAFARYGLDGDWAASMTHWGEDLLRRDTERGGRQLDAALVSSERDRALQEARDLWGRLLLCARLSGLGRTLAAGRAPRAALPLYDQLSATRARIEGEGLAAQLADHGFGPADRAALDRALAQLLPLHQAHGRARRARRDATGPLLTVRGALLGDLLRLCAAAPRALSGVRPPTLRALLSLPG